MQITHLATLSMNPVKVKLRSIQHANVGKCSKYLLKWSNKKLNFVFLMFEEMSVWKLALNRTLHSWKLKDESPKVLKW